MKEPKLTGNIHEDINIVYEATEYFYSLISGLYDEEMAQNNENRRRMPIFLEILSMKDRTQDVLEHAKRMRHEETRYVYGPLDI